MKKQCEKFPSWGFKGLLSVALSGLAVGAFAQAAEVCTGTPYTIASTVNASSASTYQWLENGLVLTGATATTYTVWNNKPDGVYTYIRQAKSADCNEWQSSNEFTLTVFACSFTAGTETGATATFTDPRDGKPYKTVVMPDGKTWFAQNLNYTKGLAYNAYSFEANDKRFTVNGNGVPAIGSYWCPAVNETVASGNEADCNMYGALYTWETAMMIDGKYADEAKTSSAWDESWLSGNYYTSGAPGSTANADKNNARGRTTVKGGGRGICPLGWHVPTDREWAQMLDKVEGDGIDTYTSQTDVGWYGSTEQAIGAGRKIKSTAVCGNTDDPCWLATAPNGSNTTGFSAVPAGWRHPHGAVFQFRRSYVYFLTSSVVDLSSNWARQLAYYAQNVNRIHMLRQFGMTVRCISD
jgi:uncharacterized protein (TIGR02145 family)